jgi:hypothetical protein
METGFIKKIEKCMVDNCPHCNRCAAMVSEKNRIQTAEVKNNSGLYNREAEQYYFYFETNRAS